MISCSLTKSLNWPNLSLCFYDLGVLFSSDKFLHKQRERWGVGLGGDLTWFLYRFT